LSGLIEGAQELTIDVVQRRVVNGRRRRVLQKLSILDLRSVRRGDGEGDARGGVIDPVPDINRAV
jgi:hypothetical protein